MKIAKILGSIVGVLVVLLILALLGVWLLVNPNNFKPKIVAAVKQSTGRDLILNGDIKLSVFPWIALKLGPASLGSPPAFNGAPFLSFNRADVRVKLLPLLSKELEVARVELDGLDLRLSRDAKGQGNWEMSQETAPATPVPEQKSGSGTSLQSIAGIKVTHGRVAYDKYLIENFDLETGSISARSTVPVSMSFDANRGTPGESVNLAAKLDFENDPDRQEMKVAALNVSGTITRPGDARPMHYDFSVPSLDANLDKQTLSVPAFSATLSSAHVTGKLSGTQISSDLHLAGSVALGQLVLGEFAPRFGIQLPKTSDPKALSSFSAGTDFAYDAQAASLENLQIKLDDTTLKGSINVATEKATAVKFALSADHIDLDRYRSPPGATPDPKSAAANQPAPKATADASPPLIAAGTFSLAAAQAGGLDFSNLNVTVDMKNNVTHLFPLVAQLYGGKYSGDLTYDARTATPSISMDEHLSGVDMAQLVAITKAKGRVSGKATINIKGTARGTGADDIMKTLNGHFDANLVNGAIEGVDVAYELAFAQSLLNKQTSTSVQDTKRTKFDAFKDSAQITNGIADTRDLSIVSPVVKVSGQGTINLPSSAIDMTLLASIMKSANSSAVDIPLKISGTYNDPSVKPDMEALAKGAIKDKLQDVLKKNGLGDFFKH